MDITLKWLKKKHRRRSRRTWICPGVPSRFLSVSARVSPTSSTSTRLRPLSSFAHPQHPCARARALYYPRGFVLKVLLLGTFPLFWRIFARQKIIVWFFFTFFFILNIFFLLGKNVNTLLLFGFLQKKKTRYKTQNATLCDAVYRRRRNEKSGLSNSIPRARERGGVSRAFSRRRRNPSSCPVLFFSSSKSFY